VLIEGTPEVMLYTVDLQKNFAEEPFITQLWALPLDLAA
jgi:hypothetical protein